MLTYRVDIGDLHTHQFQVSLTVPRPGAEVELALPVWIPGSYMVRDFAKHLSQLQAEQGGQPCTITQLDKSRWRVRCTGRGALRLRWRIYAFDNSVRTAWLDAQRGFFNGTSLLLRVVGREQQPHQLRLGKLPTGWQVATSLAPAPEGGRNRYQAADYDELVDHPVELGPFWQGQFLAGGLPHVLAVSGAWPRADLDRLLADSRAICQTVLAFWHGQAALRDGPAPLDIPFGRYVFLLNLVDSGYGGLEHRASTALLANRRDVPAQGAEPVGEGYTTLLGLVCHEYFHAWHVKRLKPLELAQPDYQRENHTRLLWLFEGFTSYYEELLLRRAGRVDAAQYLRLLARLVNGAAQWPGRHHHSLADSSFEAWTKYYQRDENTANTTVSYYGQGALVALALDLGLRQRGHSLDAVMRQLWQASGGGPVGEADLLNALQAVAGRRTAQALGAQLQAWVHGCEDPPLADLLRAHGVQWRTEPVGLSARLGLKLSEGPVSGVQVKQVLADGAAAAAGVSAGDELLAVDGWRIRRLDEAQAWVAHGADIDLLLCRDQRVVSLRVPALPAEQAPVKVLLSPDAQARGAALARRQRWIGG